jgi:NtrC-family two-component system response regulator AlgB
MRRGAFDYLPKPFTPGQLEAVVGRVAEVRTLERRVSLLQAEGSERTEVLESSSAAMRRVLDIAQQVAVSDASVLLRGESGTGKGVLAAAIHRWSSRRDQPMASVSCPSLSADLLESELFGHARGAFTGAVRDHIGRVEAASGGTLFLDEIGDLPMALQPKLLRFLQDRHFERVGESRTRRADIRLIAATNLDLEGAVKAGKFREDLFYRLNVIELVIPPLRERIEDVLPLAEHLLASLRRGPRPAGFSSESAAALAAYSWPGNVRELRNVVERCAILCRGDQVGLNDLLPPVVSASLSGASGDGARSSKRGVELGDLVPVEQVEREHIRRVLDRSSSLEMAAKVLEIDVATLWRKRRKFGI